MLKAAPELSQARCGDAALARFGHDRGGARFGELPVGLAAAYAWDGVGLEGGFAKGEVHIALLGHPGPASF